jgi:hypothetical protein
VLAKNPSDLMAKVKDLSISDYSLMSFLSFELKKKISSYFTIDPFTVPDPFPIKDDHLYFIIVDSSNTDRIIAIVALKDNVDIASWETILGNEMSQLELPPNDVLSLKQQLMPKKNDNFYPLRKESSTIGFICFAFEICGKRDP